MEKLPQQTKLEEELIDLKRNLPTLIEYNILNAGLIRAKYIALIDEGFKPEEALKLCMEVKM